jgi:hypothetical protein
VETLYCTCESPVIDIEHDVGCRRCGLPVDFSPRPADDDLAGGRNTITRQAPVDLATPRRRGGTLQ